MTGGRGGCARDRVPTVTIIKKGASLQLLVLLLPLLKLFLSLATLLLLSPSASASVRGA